MGLHLIEEDLDWIERGIPDLVLVYEIEEFLRKQAVFTEFLDVRDGNREC